ncbi:MAG: response regulator [Tannerellaceae bacterium]|nr:response regulator [Tannerellaceae bacterium]
MENRIILTICLLIGLLVEWNGHAGAVNQYKFRTVSPEGGFYYDGVKAIQQDSYGFVWIIMDNDLFRFDGYEYKRYYPLFRELDPQQKWVFNDIETGPEGQLFVATTNGLYGYNRLQDSFEKWVDGYVNFIEIDHRKNIWVKQNHQLQLWDEEAQTFLIPLYKEHPVNAAVLAGNQKDLFVATQYGRIFRYDYDACEFDLLYVFPASHYIVDMKMAEGKLWILFRDQGLYKLDILTATAGDPVPLFRNLANERILPRSLYIDKHGFIWIGTQRGLYIMDPDTFEYTHYLSSRSDPFSLPNNSIWTIQEDFQQNVWIGTFSGQVCYVNPEEKPRFQTSRQKTQGLSHKVVSSFAETGPYVWIGTEGGGLNRMDRQTGEFTWFRSRKNGPGLSYDNVKSIAPDHQGNLWIAMFRGGLDCYDIEKDRFTHFKNEKGVPPLLLTNDLRKVITDGDRGLWIAYQYYKLALSYYDFREKRFTHYELDTDETTSFVFDICQTNESFLWVITHKNLYLLNKKDGVIKRMAGSDSFYWNAQTLCSDGANYLWIGTIGNGLIRYHIKTGTITLYDGILRYGVSSVFSICPDNDGNLWVGTDQGLFKYNIPEDSWLRFDEADGVQGEVYYPLSCMKSRSGELFFGGSRGFTIVNPREISANPYQPRVIISDFYIDQVPVRPVTKNRTLSFLSSPYEGEIRLSHRETNFGFRFSSDNYLAPEKNRFRYRLRGYDNRWIETDATDRSAFYSKVPPGDYFFEILAANNDGVWSDTPTLIRIKRLPAPWFSLPAYLLYTLVLGGIVYLIVRYYLHQKRLKMQLYMDQLDKQKKEEIHQAQLQFFTNISHDFRTPLSLILGTVDRLKQEKTGENYFPILERNSRRLLNLVNDLMDFRSISNNKMTLQVEPVDINAFVQQIAGDFEEYAAQHEINFRIQCDPLLNQPVFIDRQVLDKIIMNLLNNSFKYTPHGGYVYIETYKDITTINSGYPDSYTIEEGTKVPETCFGIVVRDSGVGISGDSIRKVFDRFYKVKTVNAGSHLGTGIGLALVKALVLLHKGAITIHSERGKGTDMIVTLPATADYYAPAEIAFIASREEPESMQPVPEETVSPEEKRVVEEIVRDKKRILLAEDNEELRKLVVQSLSGLYEVVEAANGREAYEVLHEKEIDLIVSDIMMPEKDGITFCQEVKSDVNTSHIPLMLFTARTGLESKLEGAHSGADFYFEKPVDPQLLLMTIGNIFKRQEQLKEYYARNYFADTSELVQNESDSKFFKHFVEIIDTHLDQPEMDIQYIATQLSISRSKLYTKIKSMTGKSVVEFILSYRLRKAARLIVEQDLSMREVMDQIGIESQSYFTRTFKKEFGDPPTVFASKHKKASPETASGEEKVK